MAKIIEEFTGQPVEFAKETEPEMKLELIMPYFTSKKES